MPPPSRLLSFYFIHHLLLLYGPAHALDLGIHANTGLSLEKYCSRTCESSFCSGYKINFTPKLISIKRDLRFLTTTAITAEKGVMPEVAPFLRYGKYCGILYGGCPGEKPCDGLDACCMKHDACIISKQYDYLNQECNQNLLNCVGNFKKARGKSFPGNTCKAADVIKVITIAMDAALLAAGHHPQP